MPNTPTIVAAATSLAALLCGALTCHAGSTVVGGKAADRGVDISPLPGGGFVAVGVTASTGAGGDDVYLVRLNDDTDVVWERAIGGEGEDAGWAVHPLASGGFVVVGFTTSRGAGALDCSLFATDTDGTVLWTKTYGGADDDRCWALAPTLDGGFVLAGETASAGAGKRDCFVIRTDGVGNQLWSKTFGGSDDDRCFSVAPAADGGFVVAGQTYSEGAGDRDAWVLKIDARGILQWSTTHGGEASDVAHSVVADGSGSYLVTGYTTSFAASPDDPMILKIADDGTIENVSVIAMSGHNRAITGVVTPDGGLCLAGLTVAGRPRTVAAMMAKVDADGVLMWSEEIAPTSSGDSFGYGVTTTEDGRCVMVGHTTVGSSGSIDLLVARSGTSAPEP